jgi:hypothetical protein
MEVSTDGTVASVRIENDRKTDTLGLRVCRRPIDNMLMDM